MFHTSAYATGMPSSAAGFLSGILGYAQLRSNGTKSCASWNMKKKVWWWYHSSYTGRTHPIGFKPIQIVKENCIMIWIKDWRTMITECLFQEDSSHFPTPLLTPFNSLCSTQCSIFQRWRELCPSSSFQSSRVCHYLTWIPSYINNGKRSHHKENSCKHPQKC